jgi:uncharacterized protein YjbI with pentapeptide repeats
LEIGYNTGVIRFAFAILRRSASMLEPRRAPVRPRVISPVSGETLLLEDEIHALIERAASGMVWVTGGSGSGKSTALAHLLAVLPPFSQASRHDDWLLLYEPQKLVVGCGIPGTAPEDALVAYEMAPWTEDEFIEYLLAAHRERCPAVMAKCKASEGHELLSGNPELWRGVLDLLAADDTIPTVKEALRRLFDLRLTDPATRERVSDWCLGVYQSFAAAKGNSALLGAKLGWKFEDDWSGTDWGPLLWHAGVMLLLAAERFAAELRSSEPCPFLEYAFPLDVIEETAKLIRDDERVLDRLKDVMGAKRRVLHPMAASLLHAADIGWRPELRAVSGWRKLFAEGKLLVPLLRDAFLRGVVWRDLTLPQVDFTRTDLSSADLSNAALDDGDARLANLHGAQLTGASLLRFCADQSALVQADLSYIRAQKSSFIAADAAGARFEGALLKEASFRQTNLKNANFVRANLARAVLVDADIEGADFSQAELAGAWLTGLTLRLAEFRQCSFQGAEMSDCDLERMSLPGAEFEYAVLKGALLTGTVMPRANFRSANLVNTGLAEIDWEQADLRDADLRGASFHMGSSRSGLVDSTIASYGSRTGFYTDDYNEQDFKTPEEIRKANLRGADLRGANIDGVDFYLVDLRDARYDADQEQQFRSCGAILESRVE